MGWSQTRNKKLRIAAIGAGASGLAILRIFAEEFRKEIQAGDCELVCFEKRNDAVGIWLPDHSNTMLQTSVPDTPLYNCLTTNLPLPIMLYPSRDPTPSTHLFPPAHAVLEYLQGYETQFKLRQFIRFNTVVSRTSLTTPTTYIAFWNDTTRQWEVTIHPRDQPDNPNNLHFDHLLVTNGHYAKSHFVTYPGLDDWSASGSRSIIHSMWYREPSQCHGLRVLIIGGGPSGNDIAGDLCKVAKEIIQSVRSFEDEDTGPSFSKAANIIHSMWYREPSQYHGLRVLIIGGGPSGNDIAGDLCKVAKETIQSVRSFEDEDTGPVTKRGKIDHLTTDGLVVFESGKQAYVDRIILATGYEYDFPFLPQLHLNYDQELELCKARNKKLTEVHKGPERVAKHWHILDGDAQFAHREELWRLAGENRSCPEWSSKIYEAKFILRDEWKDLVRTGEADSWAKGVGERGMKDWVELMHRVLRRAEERGQN
ncbi:hypothetical protein RSAG8_01573, partial [Rhizoctonia solani AG-8 WAC10335]